MLPVEPLGGLGRPPLPASAAGAEARHSAATATTSAKRTGCLEWDMGGLNLRERCAERAGAARVSAAAEPVAPLPRLFGTIGGLPTRLELS